MADLELLQSLLGVLGAQWARELYSILNGVVTAVLAMFVLWTTTQFALMLLKIYNC